MVGIERFVTPEHIFAPKVGMRAARMHGCVWLEVLLDEELVLLEGQLDILRVGIRLGNAIKVTTDAILL